MDHDTVTSFEKPADTEHQYGLPVEMGSDAVGAVIKDVTGKTNPENDGEWGRLVEVSDQARFEIDNNRSDNPEYPQNSIGDKLKDWPGEAQDSFTKRVAIRLFYTQHSGKNLLGMNSYGRTTRGGIEVSFLKLDPGVYCGKDVAYERSLFKDNEGTTTDINAAAISAARETAKERLLRSDASGDALGDFNGGVMAVDAIAEATAEMSLDLVNKLADRVNKHGATKFWPNEQEEQQGTPYERKLNTAVEEAVGMIRDWDRDGEHTTQFLRQVIENIIDSGMLTANPAHVQPEILNKTPTLYGFLSLENTVDYVDDVWAKKEQAARDAKAAQDGEKAQRLQAISQMLGEAFN